MLRTRSASQNNMALSIERCTGEVLGVFTGAVPSTDCVKFAVSKGLVRHPRVSPEPSLLPG